MHRLLRIHDLRRTFVTMSLEADASLPVLKRQLAHRSNTRAFAHLPTADRDALKAGSDVLSEHVPGI